MKALSISLPSGTKYDGDVHVVLCANDDEQIAKTAAKVAIKTFTEPPSPTDVVSAEMTRPTISIRIV